MRARPRRTDRHGRIVRWRPQGGDHGAEGFACVRSVMARDPKVHRDGPHDGTGPTDAGNPCAFPDGMPIDTSGPTQSRAYGDENGFAGISDERMHSGDTLTGEVRRFGPARTAARSRASPGPRTGRAMFIGLQHPGAPFPDGEGAFLPFTIIAMKRADGDIVGGGPRGRTFPAGRPAGSGVRIVRDRRDVARASFRSGGQRHRPSLEGDPSGSTGGRDGWS